VLLGGKLVNKVKGGRGKQEKDPQWGGKDPLDRYGMEKSSSLERYGQAANRDGEISQLELD